MNNIIKRVWNQNRLVNIEDLTGMMFQAEADGHTFEISGVDDDGNPVELSGTVSGVFMRPDNSDVVLTGSASGGVASVTLDEDCYAIPGRFGLTIFVTSDDQTMAVYACVGTVSRTSTGNVAGDTPASVEDLVNAINAAISDLDSAIGQIPASYANVMAAIAPTYSSSALYPVGSYTWYDGALYCCITPITTAEGWTAAHWAPAIIGNDVSNLKNAIKPLIINAPDINQYFYKKDIYINNSGVEATLSGYDTYKIPCKEGQIIRISWGDLAEAPWQGIDVGYAWKVFKSDNSFVQIRANSNNNGYVYTNNKEGIAICPAGTVYSTLTVKRGNESGVKIQIDYPYENAKADDKISCNRVVHTINEDNAIKTQFYFNYSSQIFAVLGASVKALMFHVYTGDVIDFTTIRTGMSMRATFRTKGGTMSAVGTVVGSSFTYTVEADGVITVFYLADEAGDAVYKPKNQIKIEAKNVIGLSDGTQFDGLSGVAFGTSLTYRKVSGNGYLTRLEPLSGITFDNQGIGSSTILGDGGALDMLAAIKAYESYSDKSVCILEGFVNDWYLNKTLGEWDDTEEATVCGCVRSALNYMLSQNDNMTTFLILDHYGRQYSTLDCSTTAKNGSGYTQYEYYSEIAKVAESLGIPVIKEFEVSQISENTPQYLADNIHCNVLGATQSGNAIWGQMKQYPLNVK